MTAHDLKLACPAYKMLSQGRVCERCRGGQIHNVLLHRCVKDSVAVSGLVFLETLIHRSFGLYRDTLDRLVAPSRFYRDKLVEWGWDAGRDRLHPELHRRQTSSRLAPTKATTLFTPDGSRRRKGLATLVRAAALSQQRLVLAGSGPEEAALRRLATRTRRRR